MNLKELTQNDLLNQLVAAFRQEDISYGQDWKLEN